MLKIWSDDYNGTEISQDGAFTYPVIVKVPPTGGMHEQVLYLRHDDLSGDLAESSYDVTVTPSDDFDSDQSGWVQLAPDVAGAPGTYGVGGAPLVIGDILTGNIKAFWVKVTVPVTPDIGVREDVYLKLSASQTPSYKDIDLNEGTFFKCEYNAEEDAILFDVTGEEGEWLSPWHDISVYTDLDGIGYDFEGTHAYLEYRTSPDASDLTAKAWVSAVSDLALSDSYIQFKIRFLKNAQVGMVGLVQRVYGNTDFSVFKSEFIGAQMPHTTNPGEGIGATKSVKWSGYFYAPDTGTYGWEIQSDDGHRMYVNGNLLLEKWTPAIDSGTLTTTATIYLTEGWHYVEFDYYHVAGDDFIWTYVTPPGSARRVIALTDFSPTPMTLKAKDLFIQYSGPRDFKYDVQVYDGPDVPQLIAPENGYSTPFFRPELTVYQRNCTSVEFQMDNDYNFSTQYMTTFIVNCAPGEEVIGQAHDGARPHGTWYWRARGIHNGEYSAWSDWRFLYIEELIPHDEFLYLNANVGFAVHDSIEDDRFVYLNSNVGLALHDSIVDDRFFYLNANVDLGIGKVIYPFYDDTQTRKLEFPEDAEFEETT